MKKEVKRFFVSLLLLITAMTVLQTGTLAASTSTVEVSIPVAKVVSGSTPSSPATFTFVLKSGKTGNPMPASDKITITGSGNAQFGSMVFSEPGDYYYTVTENNDAAARYTYDSSVYNVLVQITSDELGNLSSTLAISKTGTVEKFSKAVFTNKYTTPSSPSDGGYKTGDDRNLWLWYVVIVASIAGLFGFLFAGRKKSKSSKTK